MSRGQEDIDPAAVAIGLAALGLQVARGATGRAMSAAQPLSRVVLDPPWLPTRLRPGVWLETLTRGGEQQASALRAELSRRIDGIVPVLVDEVLRRVDPTDLVLRHVDVDRVVAAVDLDAAAGSLDVEAVVERVDVDAVVRRADLDAAVERVDLDAVLDRLDLTAIVLERVDLDAVVTAVLDRVDLIVLANDVIEGVDLPRIIRESTGSVASETVQGARMQGVAADEAVSRVVDRLLLRRRDRTVLPATAYGVGSRPDTPDRTDDTTGGVP